MISSSSRTRKRAGNIIKDSTHLFRLLPSGRRYRIITLTNSWTVSLPYAYSWSFRQLLHSAPQLQLLSGTNTYIACRPIHDALCCISIPHFMDTVVFHIVCIFHVSSVYTICLCIKRKLSFGIIYVKTPRMYEWTYLANKADSGFTIIVPSTPLKAGDLHSLCVLVSAPRQEEELRRRHHHQCLWYSEKTVQCLFWQANLERQKWF